MHIAFYTNVSRNYYMAGRLALPEGVSCAAYYVQGEDEWSPAHMRISAAADAVLFLWMGTGLDRPFLQRASAYLLSARKCHAFLVENSGAERISHGMTDDDLMELRRYFRFDGEENVRGAMLYLAARFGGYTGEVPPPQEQPWHGVWHPDYRGNCTDIAAYRAAHVDPARPTAGIVFYRSEWIMGDFTYHTALVRAFEAAGLNVVPVFTNTLANAELGSPPFAETLHRYFYRDGEPAVDVVVSCLKFSLHAAGTPIEELVRLGVPWLQAYTILAERVEWEDSLIGMNAMEVSISVSLPEFDGAIHAVPIAAKQRMEDGLSVYVALPERMELLARRAHRYAVLRRKANAEKKIAVIFHNYPPTNASIGSAAGLDSPESVVRLLRAMKEAGYRVENIPETAQALMDEITAQATNDRRYLTDAQIQNACGRLSAADYRDYFETLPARVRERMCADWGELPGDVLVADDAFILPGIEKGNILITIQPPRGFGEDPGKLLHSPDAAPTHHYLAFYHWLRTVRRVDAVVHVGTHGSLEWLPGKNAGLSPSCYPDISIGDLPDIYPYWMTIVGEGIQAKRRGAACLISHLSPPMSLAGACDDIAELERALDEYGHFARTQPESADAAAELVREAARAAHLEDEVPEEEDFESYALRLHNYITDLKNLQIRTGLHVLGRMPPEDDLVDYVKSLVRMDNGDIPALTRVLAEGQGYDYDALLDAGGTLLPDGTTYGMALDCLEELGTHLVAALMTRDFSPDAVNAVMETLTAGECRAQMHPQLARVLSYVCTDIVPNLRRTDEEIVHTITALSGAYIEPAPGGAPSSGGADLLPTGRNFFGIDPRTLPSPAAWELGKQLGDAVIEDYIREEGHYPEAVGIVLWAGSNMRSHGQCIAEFLYLMGIRPVWQQPSGRVRAIEVIPLAELGRPRIDVTGRISGLFRDTMPDGARWLDEAARMAGALDESHEENYIRKHMEEDTAELIAAGENEATAWEKASYRIFGDPPGAYGAGIGALLESKEWETLDDLAAVYTRFSGHAYSGGVCGNYEPEIFRRRMAGLVVTIKNEDNRETHMFSSDDFNAYHGGMIATVRALTGKAPRSYSGDSSDRRRTCVRTVQAEAKRIFRAEAMNPKFINGMKKHGYKGASDLASYLAHSYQWDATSAVMEDWMYEKYAEKYALDEDMREWMNEVNPWALHRIAETLLEAAHRGLWRAQEETLAQLRELYLSMEGELEERADG
ncbi:cobaltochelatase subunit CobN [Selenomonas artemidis]|uniref:cobaltochelatase subunit CobN n=1 Tax=Selenomonas artemidis TaxID=671224 RepID=UPI0028F0E950|nr:cobaltochelatase subunit CobN [Selenomonas artemidis]